MVFVVDPDGTVRDYPDDHYHVQAARTGVVLSGELSGDRRVDDRTYRLATAEEVRAVLDDVAGQLEAHIASLKEA